jgi:hypothetical protein
MALVPQGCNPHIRRRENLKSSWTGRSQGLAWYGSYLSQQDALRWNCRHLATNCSHHGHAVVRSHQRSMTVSASGTGNALILRGILRKQRVLQPCGAGGGPVTGFDTSSFDGGDEPPPNCTV